MCGTTGVVLYSVTFFEPVCPFAVYPASSLGMGLRSRKFMQELRHRRRLFRGTLLKLPVESTCVHGVAFSFGCYVQQTRFVTFSQCCQSLEFGQILGRWLTILVSTSLSRSLTRVLQYRCWLVHCCIQSGNSILNFPSPTVGLLASISP